MFNSCKEHLDIQICQDAENGVRDVVCLPCLINEHHVFPVVANSSVGVFFVSGNLDELVHQVDHLFCETTKVLHEQFENCSTLKDVMLRSVMHLFICFSKPAFVLGVP